ncbi:MAG: chorismate mutase [Candidatus Woesearchaeota archaeon]
MRRLALRKERKRIDDIDSRIISLLSKRKNLAGKLGRLKKGKGLKMTDKAREKEVMENARAMAREKGIDEQFTTELFRRIIKYSKEKQK